MPATATPASAFAPDIQAALDSIGQIKSGFLPPFLSRAELDACLTAWHKLYNDPSIGLDNQRFIVNHRLYLEPAFARVATHPAVQEVVRRVIGCQ